MIDTFTRRIASVTIRGEGTSILAVDILRTGSRCLMIGDADIDCDGSGGNPDHDRFYQPETTYRMPDGSSLNAYRTKFIVLPPSAFKNVSEKVLGCQAYATNLRTGVRSVAMVGDSGPTFKIGEVSPALARAIGINPNPVNGGEDDYDAVLYEWFPGVPAVIDGITYPLQSFHVG